MVGNVTPAPLIESNYNALDSKDAGIYFPRVQRTRGVSWRNWFACCVTSRKPIDLFQTELDQTGPDQNQRIWETADLGWWDFQKRRFNSYWLMKNIYSRSKRLEAETEKIPLAEVDKRWEEMHAVNAREMREFAEQAKGLMIKACQFMASIQGVVPDPYVKEFMILTDDLPVSTIDEVYEVIKRDLQQTVKEIFEWFDPVPIASASIGQVHKARLRCLDCVVAVKVQHDGVDRVFLEDMSTLTSIAEQVARWCPDFDFRKICSEWSESLPRELNFHEEKRALQRAFQALEKAGNKCALPKVHNSYTGKYVLVMDYIVAEPIMVLADEDYCAQHNVDKTIILTTLCDAFGIMALKDGLFHADPHPGNVRVRVDPLKPGGGVPVLLDWGLFRELTDVERLGIAKMFHNLANFDVGGVFDALHHLGFRFTAEHRNDDFRRDILEKLRGAMKDTENKAKTFENNRNERKITQARLKQEGSTIYNPTNFVDDFPSCIAFFLQMFSIVRGLCVALNAEGLPLLEIFTRHAREALIEASLASMSLPVKISSGTCVLENALQKRVRQCLHEMYMAKRIIGAQVVVVEGRQNVICDLCYGTLSSVDARPIREDTRFPLMGSVSGVGALALLRTLLRHPSCIAKKPLNMLVSNFWPQFGGGNSKVTLADLLSHGAGVQDAFPSDFSASVLDNVDAVIKSMEVMALPTPKDSRYVYLLQSFLLSKLGNCMEGKGSFVDWLKAELGPLGLDVDFPSKDGSEAVICRDLPSLARVSPSEVQASQERRKSKFNGESTPNEPEKDSRTFVEAIAFDPFAFDPLQANAGQGDTFRAGHSLGVTARGLAAMMASDVLRDTITALDGLDTAGADPTAIGWFLTGGACQWTSGGLQVFGLEHKSSFMKGRKPKGYGIMCGLGPCVLHFPNLCKSKAEYDGSVTIAVLVNDVLHGRGATVQVLEEILSKYGYQPAWTNPPVSVMVDASRISQLPEVKPLLGSTGTIKAIIEELRPHQRAKTTSPFMLRCLIGCTGRFAPARDTRLNSVNTCANGPEAKSKLPAVHRCMKRLATVCSP